jgi:hypothetical protein
MHGDGVTYVLLSLIYCKSPMLIKDDTNNLDLASQNHLKILNIFFHFKVNKQNYTLLPQKGVCDKGVH